MPDEKVAIHIRKPVFVRASVIMGKEDIDMTGLSLFIVFDMYEEERPD